MSAEQSTSRAWPLFAAIMKYAKPYKLAFIFSVLLLAADIVYDVGYALVQQLFVDAAERRQMDTLFTLTGVSLAAGIGIILFFTLQFYLRNKVQSLMQRDLSTDVFQQIAALPMPSLLKFHSGDLVSRTTRDVQQANGMVANIVYELTYNIVLFVVAFAYLATINWQLALLVVLSAPLVFAIGRLFDRKLRAYGGQLQKKDAEVRGFLQETMQGLSIVRIFQMEPAVAAEYGEKRTAQNRLQVKNMLHRTSMNQSVYLANQLVMIVCVYFTAYTAIEGTLTAGQVLAFLVLISRVQNPLLSVINTWGNFQQGLGAGERIFALFKSVGGAKRPRIGHAEQAAASEQALHVESAIDDEEGSENEAAVDAEPIVAVREATVALESGEGEQTTLLAGVTMTVRSGEFVAIVGPSGAGKSTLARLCCGLIPPTTGEVKVLGSRLEEQPAAAETLRSISYVPQTPYLFTGTVRDNIGLGVEDATDEEIKWAARAACADSFIEKLDGGYDSVVGERGDTLSGGQRQRITLARALIRRPKLLILDEATSALDTVTETEVMQSVIDALPGITILAVSHRESAIRQADRIVAMEGGKVVEEGSRAELLRLGGVYALLFADPQGLASES
ncbi:hypothetical protein PA598K_06479 [Paenibacillus sp. 598K]|uniref:ABC transporter ATP-binding protein n=1 Tax=Paenibacillus sp. 598K TaxID=1117987 RepID=UPI000FFA288B|nr:ABC transporter ATP-binding protein [Paenibacillus sp. 598K]GBF77898.1 hypothetical protein PA598K_06479 [Paenibacillus sp. 598K]